VTGKDSFLMGPSGYGFMHPSIIAPDDPLLQEMIDRTSAAAALLSSSACVPCHLLKIDSTFTCTSAPGCDILASWYHSLDR
jgi:hypothetical protein